ncbi:MAG: hypothetical protein L0346_34390 [Chloroflexi bacterium]|nr:hypothetical protein [Chloroflexota bacterium]
MAGLSEQQKGQLSRLLVQLDQAGLMEARDMIDALLDDPADSEPAGDGDTAIGDSGGRGWVELKMINGCGPYAYKRWRQGGRLRSEYIGKVKA